MELGKKNREHPELRPRDREVFIGNVRLYLNGSKDVFYWVPGMDRPRKLKKGERLGEWAYNSVGGDAEGLRPLFAKEPKGSKRAER